MNNHEIISRQLVFIKFLFEQGIQASEKKEPFSSVALLLFHDSIELFLEMITTQYNINSGNVSFMGYWEVINEEFKKRNIELLGYKEPLRKLNKDRVNLKHSGLHPSKMDLDGHRVNALNFFLDNCSKVFGVQFDEIKLLSLVPYEEVRKFLELALLYAKKEEFLDSAFNYSIALDVLINEYQKNKKGFYGDNLFELKKSPEYKEVRYLIAETPELNEGLKDFISQVEDSISELQRIVTILALDINYKDYMRFKSIVPDIYIDASGTYRSSYGHKEKITSEDLSFCENFIIDSSLMLFHDDFESYPNQEMRRALFKRT